MRKIVVGAMASIDGVMQAPGGPTEDPTKGFRFGGWVMPHFDEEGGAEIGRLFDEEFDLLLGRRTYEIFAAYWPYAEGKEYDDIAKPFNRATKYVATRKGVDLSWKGSVALRDGVKEVAKLLYSSMILSRSENASMLLVTICPPGPASEDLGQPGAPAGREPTQKHRCLLFSVL